jgi:hypothetical protein
MFLRAAWFLWGAIIALTILLLVLFSPAAHAADRVMRAQSGETITLQDGACKSAMLLELAYPQYKKLLKAAVYADAAGKNKVVGCYLEHEGNAHLVFEDGDRFVIPMTEFRGAGQFQHKPGTRPNARTWDA